MWCVKLKRMMLGAMIVAAIIAAGFVAFLVYDYVPFGGSTQNAGQNTGNMSGTVGYVNGYRINVYYNGELVKQLSLSDLHKLRNYVFVDSRGHKQEGPLLYSVIRYALGNVSFKYVLVRGLRGNAEENLSYDVVSNPEDYVILDYTKQGTVKLCGREDVLPYSEWVKDVTDIVVGG